MLHALEAGGEVPVPAHSPKREGRPKTVDCPSERIHEDLAHQLPIRAHHIDSDVSFLLLCIHAISLEPGGCSKGDQLGQRPMVDRQYSTRPRDSIRPAAVDDSGARSPASLARREAFYQEM